MFGGHLPWNMVIAGIVIGAVIIVVDQFLKAYGKTGIRAPVLAAAVGIYLPLELEVPIFLGGLLAWYVQRRLLAGAAGVQHSPEEARASQSQRACCSRPASSRVKRSSAC